MKATDTNFYPKKRPLLSKKAPKEEIFMNFSALPYVPKTANRTERNRDMIGEKQSSIQEIDFNLMSAHNNSGDVDSLQTHNVVLNNSQIMSWADSNTRTGSKDHIKR